MKPRPHSRPLSLFLALGLLATESGCGASSTGPSGEGLVVLSEDPELHGLGPDELAERGLRPYYHDFGRVPFGDTVEHVFRLKNTDSEPVTIIRMTPACGCTIARIGYRTPAGELVRGSTDPAAKEILTLPPDTVAELVLRMETGKVRMVNQDRTYSVSIACTSKNRAFLQLETHVYVERAFQSTPNPIDLGRVPESGGGRGRTEVIRTGTSGASLVRLGDLPDDVEASMQLVDRFGVEMWVIEVQLLPPQGRGALVRSFQVLAETPDGLPYRPLEVELRAQIVDDVDWTPQRMFLRKAVASTEPLQAEVEVYSLLEGMRFEIRDGRLVGSGHDRLDLYWRPYYGTQGKSERWIVGLRTRPPHGEDVLSGKAVLYLDLPQLPEIEIGYVVHPN